MAADWLTPRHAVGILAGRWTLVVLAELVNGGRRYQDLHDRVEGIAHKVLTDTLRRAERDGLITRHLDTSTRSTRARAGGSSTSPPPGGGPDPSPPACRRPLPS